MTVLWMAFSLFLLMDSIGNIPIFIALLKDISPQRQRVVILRELFIALGVIVLFFFIGEPLLSFLKITQYSVLISGAVILFLIAIKMIFPAPKNGLPEHHGKEPFIVPLAVPLIAGPAVLAAVMLYSHEQQNQWMTLLAVVIAWIASTLILLCSSFLKKWLGWRGISACERLMGLILTMIAVQMFLEGVSQYTHPHVIAP